ncbi:MAG TPA: hypothetical protein DEQ02_04070 [Ruminococcaceae bacterium]|nr:hypothetical protein [Oscillospiraceae bacterium]
MLCEKCGKNQATTHIQKTVAGVSEEHHLCASCAAQLGYSHFTFDMGDLWPYLFGEEKPGAAVEKETRCENCGMSFADFLKSKRVGCAVCYKAFEERLAPSLERIHGSVTHRGKLPRHAAWQSEKNKKLASLKKEMAGAVESQNYEQAALLRDEIKRLEERVTENE